MPLYIVRMTFGRSSVLLTSHTQSATALGKLGHPDGELNLTRAAAKHGVIQMVRSCVGDIPLSVSIDCVDPHSCIMFL